MASGTASYDAGTYVSGEQWAYVDFGGVVPTTPGSTYVLRFEPVGGSSHNLSQCVNATCYPDGTAHYSSMYNK